MLQRPEMFILGTPLHYRMYQKLEFTQEVSVQHPTAAYKLHTVYFATNLIWCPKSRERVKTEEQQQKTKLLYLKQMWFYLHLANLILAWNSTKSAPLNGHYPKLQFSTCTWFSHAQSQILTEHPYTACKWKYLHTFKLNAFRQTSSSLWIPSKAIFC